MLQDKLKKNFHFLGECNELKYIKDFTVKVNKLLEKIPHRDRRALRFNRQLSVVIRLNIIFHEGCRTELIFNFLKEDMYVALHFI